MPLLPSQTDSGAQPTQEEILDLIEAARYGELDTLQDFIARFSAAPISQAIDEYGLTPLHMAAANGHEEVAKLLLEVLPVEFLVKKNERGNTPLHWAALNGHLPVLRLLVPLLTPEQLLIQNEAGDTASDLAEERATEKTLECAGFIEGHLPEDEKETEGVKEEPVSEKEVAEDVKKMDLNKDDSTDRQSEQGTEAER